MGKAVIYVRVSSGRQVDNTSLESQEAACRQWCESNGLDIARVFVELGESAKTADRTQFQALFRYIEQNHSLISHLVVDKFDRFSRNVDEGAEYRIKLHHLRIRLCSVKEPTDITPAGKLSAQVFSAFAEFDNAVRADRALNGMQARFKEGRWLWVAPLGYLNSRGGKGKPSLIPDPERAPLVIRLFELVAAGKRSSTALAHVTALGLRSQHGNRVNLRTVVRLLRNPVYIGQIESQKWGLSGTGDFGPLVSEELFSRVQDVLSGRGNHSVPHRSENPSFPLRGFLLCTICNQPLTASMSKGKTKRYGYYSCHRVKGHIRVRADMAESNFLSLLDSLQPNEIRLRLIEAIFRRVWTDKQATAQSESNQLTAELKKLEIKKANLLQKIDSLDKSDFDHLYIGIQAEIAQAKGALICAQRSVIDVDTALSYLLHLFWNSSILWEQSDLQGKQRLARLIFPEGLPLLGTGFGTPVTHSTYRLLADETVPESILVGPEGFEPPTKGL